MKIRTLYFLSALFVGACCMTSCEDGTTDGNTDDLESIYWNKSAAFQMQLKGNVRTMVTNDTTMTTSFNQSGNYTSVITADGGDETQRLYTYANGRLMNEIYSWSWGEGRNADTTSITYGTSGKYLPIFAYNLMEMRLFKNIASVSSNYNTTRFEVSGDSMLMISSYSHQYMNASYVQMENADTTSFTFNGGLFPVTIRGYNSMYNITYASDGRFLTAEESYYGLSSTVTTFKSDSEYLLPLTVDYNQNGETFSTITYTYNENDDIISKVGENYTEEYSDYVYDAKGNWTSRSFRNKYEGAAWSSSVTQTRQFTYWD